MSKKKRFGDWEVDTVLDKQGTGAIGSLVERKSKLYLIRKVPAKSAADVARAMVGMLWKYRGHVRTLTANNGSEFCEHGGRREAENGYLLCESVFILGTRIE